MAVFATTRLGELAPGLVIAPERYHPARLLEAGPGGARLGELVELRSELCSPGEGADRLVVLDTSDVCDGFVRSGKEPVRRDALGSVKKLVRPGDVLISRLRPYLRQVGWCDGALAAVPVVCSTEFYVLAPRDGEASIAFLVPYLLSTGPQRALAASVEGGHHPRFGREALLGLPVPRAWLDAREAISRLVLEATQSRRRSDALMTRAVGWQPPSPS